MVSLSVSPASLTDARADLTTVAGVTGDAGFTEAADASYTGQGATGRLTITVSAPTQENTANEGRVDGTDLTWTALNSMTLTGMLIYKFITDDSSSIPIAFYDFSSDVVCNGGDVQVAWNASGILNTT